MHNLTKISIALLLSSGLVMADSKMYQKFDEERGAIEYNITASTEMMGVKSKTLAKKQVLFSEYGTKMLSDESKVVKQNEEITKSRVIVYMNRSILYTVDFNTKKITRMENPAFAMMGLSDKNNAQQAGMTMLKSMGGKKIGTDKVLGYGCDIWEVMGTKQCIYKGITLKAESELMGVKRLEIATKIDFDPAITAKDFQLPQFPIYDTLGKKISESDLGTLDSQNDAQEAQTSEGMAALGAALAGAMQGAGVKEGEAPTKEQEEKMKSAMEGSMLAHIKTKFVTQEKIMQFGKECLGKAETLTEANECNTKSNQMGGETDENFEEWNPQIKKEVLGYIDQGLQMVECMKKASSMGDVEKCSPTEE